MSIFRQLEKLADVLDIRDVNLNLQEGLQFLFDYFSCENVFWYQTGELCSESLKQRKKRQLRFQTIEEKITEFSPFMACKTIESASPAEVAHQLVADMQPDWELKTLPHIYCVSGEEYCLIPLFSMDLGEILGHILMVRKGSKHSFNLDDIQVCQKFFSRYLTYSLQFGAAKSMSYMDTLTPLYNQRYLSIALDREVHRAERYERPFSVLFFDIDNFKQLNDRHGHLVGSNIITELGVFLHEMIRESDYGFRFGGDEFVIVLVETAAKKAEFVAERIRKKIEKRAFRVDNTDHYITVSVGVATCPDHGKTKEQILSLADKAMYYGKRTTKNIVYVAAS